MLSSCCDANNELCNRVKSALEKDIAAANATDPEQSIPAELCRSSMAICRGGNVVAWYLDYQIQ